MFGLIVMEHLEVLMHHLLYVLLECKTQDISSSQKKMHTQVEKIDPVCYKLELVSIGEGIGDLLHGGAANAC